MIRKTKKNNRNWENFEDCKIKFYYGIEIMRIRLIKYF